MGEGHGRPLMTTAGREGCLEGCQVLLSTDISVRGQGYATTPCSGTCSAERIQRGWQPLAGTVAPEIREDLLGRVILDVGELQALELQRVAEGIDGCPLGNMTGP